MAPHPQRRVRAPPFGAALAMRAQTSPTFVFPSSGQSFSLSGSMLFQVQPLGGAKGYLWSYGVQFNVRSFKVAL